MLNTQYYYFNFEYALITLYNLKKMLSCLIFVYTMEEKIQLYYHWCYLENKLISKIRLKNKLFNAILTKDKTYNFPEMYRNTVVCIITWLINMWGLQALIK